MPNFEDVDLGRKFVPNPTIRQFQEAVWDWYETMFRGTPEEHSEKTLAMRFLEEVLELMQAMGITPDDIQRQVDYTYSRPVGYLESEIAGTNITFQHIAGTLGIDIQNVSVAELERISTPEMRKKIYDKQAYKREHGLEA